MTLFRVTAAAGVLIPLLTMGALAQTAPADRRAIQPPTLDDQIATVTGKISGEVAELATGVKNYAAQSAALQQQLAEANQQIAAKDKQIADLTKERDALKAEKLDVPQNNQKKD